MKVRLNILALALCLGIFAIGCESGCRTGSGRYDPATGQYDTNAPADPVVVTAQQVRANALNAFDLLWTTEKQFRKEAWQLSPKIKEYTDFTRGNAKQWLDDLTESISTYQLARTDENKLKLEGVIKILQNVTAQARDYAAQAAAAKQLRPQPTN